MGHGLSDRQHQILTELRDAKTGLPTRELAQRLLKRGEFEALPKAARQSLVFTVWRALKSLAERGLVESKAGPVRFVAEDHAGNRISEQTHQRIVWRAKKGTK